MIIGFVLRHLTEKGSSKYAVEVIRHFVQKGHEVHVFANEWDNIDGVQFHRVPIFTKNFFIQEFLLILFSTVMVNLERHKFDAIYSQPGRFFSPDIAGVHFCATGGKEKPKNITGSILYKIEKYNLNKAKKIIAVSNTIKDELIKSYSIPKEKINVIYNGVNLGQFSNSRNKDARLRIRKELGIKDSDAVLLFIGNPFSRKGLEYAIRVLPLVRNAKLLVIGRDNILPYLELADNLNVRRRVIYRNFVDKVSDYFAASDIFLFPTLYEPFGLVITEAMASGLPVVVSKCAGAAELIEDGKEGLLLDNPKSHEEIAEKINTLIKDKRLQNKITRQAEKAVEKLEWSKVAEKWLKVFEGVR